MPDLDYTPEPGGVGKAYFSKMLSHGDAVALVDGVTGEEDTYSSLLQRSIRTAIAIRRKRITTKDIITICSLNHFNVYVPFIASSFLGVKTANLDPRLSSSDTVYLLTLVKPKMIFVEAETVKLIEDAVAEIGLDAEIVVFGESTKHTEFSEFLKAWDEEKDFKPVEVEDLMETVGIYFSSGTTGLPKAICVNHFSLLSQGFRIGHIGFCTDHFWVCATLYWILSTLSLTSAILHKGSCVLTSKLNVADAIWDVVIMGKVKAVCIVPGTVISICDKGLPEGLDLKDFQQLSIAGGIISEEQMSAIRKMLPGVHVAVGYGMTEITGMGLQFEPNNKEHLMLMSQKLKSCGKPLQGLSYKIVDPETEQILGPYQKGELRFKTNFQMNGYYNLDASSEWDSQGWIKSGDVAYYDDDHCFYIVGRIKEMLKVWVWQVTPTQLEGILLTHPRIKDAVVFGLPHRIDGDHPAAIVVLKEPNVGDVTPEEIERYVAERVSENQTLKGGVRIVDQIPVTTTGKIKRSEIRDMVLNGLI